MPKELPGDSEDDADEPGQGLCPDPEDASRFASKVKLVSLCTQVAKGRHDWAFAQLGKFQGHAASLDLMRTHAKLEDQNPTDLDRLHQ